MPYTIYCDTTAGISELKRNPTETLSSGRGFPVAILNHNQPVFYCVPASLYEKMLECLDNHSLTALIEKRREQSEHDIDAGIIIKENALHEWNLLNSSLRREFIELINKRTQSQNIESDNITGLRDCYKLEAPEYGYRIIFQIREEQTVIFAVFSGKKKYLNPADLYAAI